MTTQTVNLTVTIVYYHSYRDILLTTVF